MDNVARVDGGGGGLAEDLRSVLTTAMPLLSGLAGPYAPIVSALAGVLANVAGRRLAAPAAPPVDPVLAASVAAALAKRNGDTLARLSAVEVRELAHQEYLRQKIGRAGG